MNALPLTRPQRVASLRGAFVARFKSFVAHRSFPCVGAKSAMNRDRLEFGMFDALADTASASALCDELGAFSRRHPSPGADPVSFVAMFRAPVANEDEFHERLWRHLQVMHDLDAAAHRWDERVSDDPADTAFSFSVASRAFFVVGMHPESSRLARQSPFPCLVFNFHDQFETMRTNGRYDALQAAIRKRDIALQGGINPTLARFGEASEAAQYSGNANAAARPCPLRVKRA